MGQRRGNAVSIEHKLPLLITGLLVVLVAVGSWAAYREVRNSALEAHAATLQRAAEQLVSLIDAGISPRLERMEALASESAIRDALRTGRWTQEAEGVLAPLLDDTDELPLEVRLSDGTVLASLGSYPAGLSPNQVDSLRAGAMSGQRGYSELVVVGGQAYTWAVTPLMVEQGTAAWASQLIDVGDDEPPPVAELLGPGFAIYYANQSGGPWIGLDGAVIPAPFPDPMMAHSTYTRSSDTASAMARAASARTSPLAIVAEAPLERVLAGPHAFLRWLLAGSLVLITLGAGTGWLLSRRITRPLRNLAAAARELGRTGEVPSVDVDRRDELGHLAEAFNQMSEEIRHARTALESKVEEADAARADAETANRLKSEFLATMSHELRTPINAIIGYTDLLLLGIPEPVSDAQREQMERIDTNGRYLLQLIDEVLDLARIEAAQLDVERQVWDAAAVVEAAVGITAPSAAAKGLTVVRKEPEDGAIFSGDRKRVEQVLVNLLSNAIKFTPTGGRIEVGTQADEETISFVVKDSGIGIPPEKLDVIFESFVQVDQSSTRAYGGVGLGLAISRKLARLMDGDITVESVPDRGSTFTLHLPAGRRERVGAA